MDFNLTPEQLLIKDSVARFAAGEHADSDPWPTFTELGWLAIGAPDELGGFGGALETLLLMEQFGRGRVVSPYVGGVVFAGTILRAAGRLDLLESLAAKRIRVRNQRRGRDCVAHQDRAPESIRGLQRTIGCRGTQR